MKNTKEKSPVLPVIKYMLKIAKQERPILFFAYFLFFAVEIIRNATNILLPKLILDELFFIYNGEDVSVHLKKVIIFAAATVFSHFFANIIMGIANRIRNLCAEWFDEYFQVVVNERIMQLDFEQTEDPEVLNQMNKAKEGMSWYSGNVCGILNQFFDIINFVAVLISVVVILFVTVPMVIPIQIVCIALLIFFSKKIREIELKSFQGLSKSNRIFGYLFFQLSDFHYGKDIRMYNSSDLFSKRSSEHLNDQIKIWTNQAEGTQKQQDRIKFDIFSFNGIEKDVTIHNTSEENTKKEIILQ